MEPFLGKKKKKRKKKEREEGREGRGRKLLLALQDGSGFPKAPGTGIRPGGGL
jgi:hypothetical protein